MSRIETYPATKPTSSGWATTSHTIASYAFNWVCDVFPVII